MTTLLLSAYPALSTPGPAADAEVREVYARLRDLPDVTAIELPLDADGAVPGADVVLPQLPDHWSVVLTTVPGTMARLGTDPAFGLASPDGGGADRAQRHLAACLRTAGRVDDVLGRPAVTRVAVVSAPSRPARPAPGTDDRVDDRVADRLADRFAERLTDVWQAASGRVSPLVEHCDAPVPGQPAAKGFLGLDDEIRAVTALRRSGLPEAALLVNWGRSAIEARSVQGPVAHAERARAAGVLAGIVLSGCSDRDGAFGPAWADAHLPPAHLPAPAGEPTSLLTAAEMRRSLAAAGGSGVVGAKFAVRPHDLAPAARAAAVAAACGAVAAAARLAEDWVHAEGPGRTV